ILIVVGEGGTAVSEGTALAVALAQRYRHPTMTIDPNDPEACAPTIAWLAAPHSPFGEAFAPSNRGPREGEAPPPYAQTLALLPDVLPRARSGYISPMLELRRLFFEDLSVGMPETLTKTVASSDVIGFAQLTGDRNPIHLSEHFAAKTTFGRRIAHGLYTAS